MSKVLWVSDVGLVEELKTVLVVKVDNQTYDSVTNGKWITDDGIFQLLKRNNYKLILENEQGNQKAIKTFGLRFAILVGYL